MNELTIKDRKVNDVIDRLNVKLLFVQFQNELIPQAIKKFAHGIIRTIDDPIDLGVSLYGKDLITADFKDKVIENQVASGYEKSSMLINEVQKTFRSVYTTNDDSIQQHFIEYCSCLKDQSSTGLSLIVDQMMESATGYTNTEH